MAISFLALLCLAIVGASFLNIFIRSMNWASTPCVEVGAGFFVAAVMSSVVLSASSAAISVSSQLLLSVCILASPFLLLRSISLWRSGQTLGLETARLSILNVFLLLFISAYLLLILANNLSRDIFPWDAFTTWMYRAKVWVLSDYPVGFTPVDQWLESGASGYTLAAAHYPISVSAIAAFSASLSGNWDDQAASLPWLFVSVANVLLIIGLCRFQHPHHSYLPLLGGALLVSIPLVHLHALLAGYADIWVMGTSGMGLASICIWTQQRSAMTLFLGALLLVLGCFWKIEGWLWLFVGVFTVAVHMLWNFLGNGIFILGGVLVFLGWSFQPLDLGALGTWGFDAEGIKLGSLGTFDIRAYNPAADYLEMTLSRGNFLLIAPLYLSALLFMLIKRQKHYAGYVFMGLSIAICHGIIFGLSAYSEYAQIGTAINRLLLQTLPVFIITITRAACTKSSNGEIAPSALKLQPDLRLKNGLIVTFCAAIVTFPLIAFIFSASSNHDVIESKPAFYSAAEFRPLIGELAEGPKGHQFSGSQLPIGVAKAPITSPGTLQPRYVVTHSWMESPATIAFYWINTNTSKAHSVPIMSSGVSVIDTANYPDYWETPIQEMGYLIPPESFDTTALKSLSMTNSLIAATPAILNHWVTPEPLNQRLINTTTGHIGAPITLHSWLSMVFLAVLIVCTSWALCTRGTLDRSVNTLFSVVCILWLLGSAAHFNQALALTTQSQRGTNQVASGTSPDGSHLHELAELVNRSQSQIDQPVFTLSLDADARFDAERLPFMLLPLRSASITENQLADIRPDIDGKLLIFGKDEVKLSEVMMRIATDKDKKPLLRGEGYAMISVGKE